MTFSRTTGEADVRASHARKASVARGSGASNGPGADAGPATASTTTGWPLQSHLELGALPTAVPCARLHTRQVLWEWRLDGLAATAELIVSELVTNAVQASAGLTGSRYAGRWMPGLPPVRLWLSSDRHHAMIQVWDGNDRQPVRQDNEPDAESGRGLLLVESLSREWDSYRVESSSGKIVWALIGQAA